MNTDQPNSGTDGASREARVRPGQHGRAPKGKLELTWANKQRKLLAHADDTYEWVAPEDERVAEVRLLHNVTTVGTTHALRKRSKDNLLIRGDALHGLTSLASLPEFRSDYVGKVRLCYIDPPFNTGQAFNQYDDGLEHSIWLTMMRDRLEQVHTLLADDGSVWVHLDDVEAHYCKVILDDIFGRDCFVTSFVWRKVDSPNDNKVTVTPDHEYILCYTKRAGAASQFNPKADDTILAAYGSVAHNGHRYRDRLLKKNGKGSLRSDRETMWYSLISPAGLAVWPVHDDGREARWSVGQTRVRQLEEAGELVWKQRGDGIGKKWVPYTREWAPDIPTRPWPSIWSDLPTTRQAKAHLTSLFPATTVFATPKPEQLLERVLTIATQPGDLVLDCFVGSGTTAAVAHKMGRRWVAIERSRETLNSFTIPRLKAVVAGNDRGGVTANVDWEGGDGFRVLDVHPSMFDRTLDGRVVVADWATNGRLAEAVAAQAGFSYDHDAAPFCGTKSRSRLAVVDGLLTPDVLALFVSWLGEGEVLDVYGTAVDPDCRAVLSELRRGSMVKKIPQSILDDYRRNSRVSGNAIDWPSMVLAAPDYAAGGSG